MSYDNVIQAFGPKLLSRRQMKYSPERVEQIKNLLERGKSREEIAALIGVTVGSLQVSCSRLGISLRRPKVNNGIRLLRRSRPVSGKGATIHDSSCDADVAPQSTKEQSQHDSQLEPLEHIQPTMLRRERPKTDEASLANFVLRMRYKGEERTTELPLTNDTIVQLAFEAEFRGMRVGELVAELVTAMTQKDLIQLVLDARPARTSPE
jgi:hypothetical protein